MAVECEHITADVVEISEFRDLAERYVVTGVPKTVFNDRLELLGAQPESTLVNALVFGIRGPSLRGPPRDSGRALPHPPFPWAESRIVRNSNCVFGMVRYWEFIANRSGQTQASGQRASPAVG